MIADLNHLDFKRATWVVKKGNFLTWRIDSFYWHGPKKFNINNKNVFIFSKDVDWMPQKKIWYLIGLRQNVWRRLRKIKGFIPFIGIDILNFKIVFVLYQNGLIRANLYYVLESLFESTAHTNLKNQVYDQSKVIV